VGSVAIDSIQQVGVSMTSRRAQIYFIAKDNKMKKCNDNNKIRAICQERSSYPKPPPTGLGKNTIVISIADARESKITQTAREQVLQKARELDW
jgi:hypothetical protein